MRLLLAFSFAISCLVCFANHERELKNIDAFSRLYGYVRYFHPSNEAHGLNWNKFATYGIEEVRNAKSDKELIERLNTLFLPVAPSIWIGTDTSIAKVNHLPPSVEAYDITYWQHEGIGFGMQNPNKKPYISRRIGIKTDYTSTDFGNLMYQIEANKFLGKQFRYSASVKCAKNMSGKAYLWSRVDLKKGGLGFFDNMSDRPISSEKWQHYSIEGSIDSNALYLNLGCLLSGNGKIFLDNVHLEIKNGEKWEEIEIKQAGFETGHLNNKPGGETWIGKGKGYEFDISEKEAIKGKKSAKIEFTGSASTVKTIEHLFDMDEAQIHLFKKELVDDIHLWMPLKLYHKEGITYPYSKSLKGLNEQLHAFKPNDELLSNTIILYNLIQHFYPYKDLIKVDWHEQFLKTVANILDSTTIQNSIPMLEKMVASLNDGHIGIYGKNKAYHVPSITWEWIEGKLIITHVLDTNINLKVGDEVLKIEDAHAKRFFDSTMQYISASTYGNRLYKAQRRTLFGVKDSRMEIKTSNGKINLTRETSYWEQAKTIRHQKEQFQKINPDLIYLNLDLISADSIVSLLPELEKAKGIICDLRGYPNGNHILIEHLLKEKDTNTTWMQIPRFVFPDQQNLQGYRTVGWELSPAKPYLGDKNVVFISDASAISYAESYMGFIEGYQLATIVGQHTAGTNGNVNTIFLNDGLSFRYTGMRVFKHNGQLLYGRGITPAIKIEKSVRGIKDGKDEYLQKAIEVATQ